MTLPDERYRAVLHTERFLRELCSPKETPRVPKSVRAAARSLLRHYPNAWELNMAAQACPDVFQENMEDVARMIKRYEQGKNNEA